MLIKIIHLHLFRKIKKRLALARIYPGIRRTKNGPHSPSIDIISDRVVTQKDYSFDWFGCATSAPILEGQEVRNIYLAKTAQRSIGK